VALSAGCITSFSLILVYKWENKKRDQQVAETGTIHVQDIEFMDLTDKENPEFRVRLSFSYMELTNLLGTSMQLEINNVDYSGLKQQYNCQRIASIGIY
jgi:hypothetical protein